MNDMQQMLARRVSHAKPDDVGRQRHGLGRGMEAAAVVNLIEPGDSMPVVCVNGVFGGRMVDVAERAVAMWGDQGGTSFGAKSSRRPISRPR